MTKLSLLNKDTSSTIDKIKKIISEKKEKVSLGNESSKKPEDIKFNHSYDNDLSKTGLGNTLRGTREVLKNQNPLIKNTLKENTMIIPIKQIILEFTTDHIRDNAGKYAAGSMLGLGAAAGYLAGDPEHGSGFLNQNDKDSGGFLTKPDTRSDFQKDLGHAAQTTTTQYHNQDKGLIGNAVDAVKGFAGNIRAENKFNDLTQAQEEYNNIKNNEGSLLTAGQMAGLGATVGGAGLLASRLKRRK